MKLYKYCDFNLRTQRVLLTNEVWYAAGQSLNDPFDCTPRQVMDVSDSELDELLGYGGVVGLEEFSRSEKKQMLLESDMTKGNNDIGVYCLCREPDNEIMWAHYANNSCGLAIGWEVEDGVPNHEDYHMWAQPVSYEGRGVLRASDLLLFARHMNGVKKADGVLISNEAMDAVNRMAKANFLSKNQIWEIEKEVRFVSPDVQGLLHFDAKMESITYGCRFDKSMLEQVRMALPKSVVEYEIVLDDEKLTRQKLV